MVSYDNSIYTISLDNQCIGLSNSMNHIEIFCFGDMSVCPDYFFINHHYFFNKDISVHAQTTILKFVICIPKLYMQGFGDKY